MGRYLRFKDYKLTEDTVDVNIGSDTIGAIDSDDTKNISKIKGVVKSVTITEPLNNFFDSINYPDEQRQTVIDIISRSENSDQAVEYFSNRTLNIKSIFGKTQDAHAINAKLLGLNKTQSQKLIDINWSTSPAIGPGEAYLSMILNNGRRPSSTEKGDLIINNSEAEVKAGGGRLVGQKGYGDAKTIRSGLYNMLANLWTVLGDPKKIQSNPLDPMPKDSNAFNFIKTSGRFTEQALIKLAKLTPAGKFSSSDIKVISEEMLKVYKLYLLNLDINANKHILKSAIKPNGSFNMSEYDKTMLYVYFSYYLSLENFNYLVLINTADARFKIMDVRSIKLSNIDKFLSVKYRPSFANDAGSQGGSYGIQLK